MPVKQTGIFQEGFNAATNQFNLCPSNGIKQRVFQLCDPAKIFRPIVAAVGINMICYISVSDRFSVVCRTNNTVDTLLTDKHISCIWIELAESPFLIPLSKLAIILTLAIYGAVVTNIVTTAFVLANLLVGKDIDDILLHRGLIDDEF